EAVVAVQGHVFLEHLATTHGEARRGQRIDHLVGEQQAVPFVLERPVQPLHQLEHGGDEGALQMLALALAQVGTGLEDGVAVRQCVQLEHALERHLGERAAAASDLQHPRMRTQLAQAMGEHAGHGGREQTTGFRCGDEVAGRPELGRAGAVVTQARRVQGQLHEPRQRDRATGCTDLRADVVGEDLAVVQGAWRGFRKIGLGMHRCGTAWRMASIAERACARCPTPAPWSWSPAPRAASARRSLAACMAKATTWPCTATPPPRKCRIWPPRSMPHAPAACWCCRPTCAGRRRLRRWWSRPWPATGAWTGW